MGKMKGKRSASSIVGCAPRCAEPHAETPEGVLTATIQRRQTVSKSIASFVGLDAHKDSTAIAAAEAGREAPRFLGTLGADRGQLLKALKSLGKPETMLVVYEAGPSFLRSESVPFLLKAHTQFAKGVDLAIEDDSRADIRRHHRLRPRLRQVEDRRSPVHQPAAAVGANPLPSPIRPPRCHSRTGPSQPRQGNNHLSSPGPPSEGRKYAMSGHPRFTAGTDCS